MKQLILFIAFVVFTNTVFCQADTVIINQAKFIVSKQLIKTEYDKTDTLLKIYRIDRGKPTYLLSHYLYSYGADCNNEFTETGSFVIEGNKIILNTKYQQKGHDPLPKSRKRIYAVNEKGTVKMIMDKETF